MESGCSDSLKVLKLLTYILTPVSSEIADSGNQSQ